MQLREKPVFFLCNL